MKKKGWFQTHVVAPIRQVPSSMGRSMNATTRQIREEFSWKRISTDVLESFQGMMTGGATTQALVFDANQVSAEEARAWARQHGHSAGTVRRQGQWLVLEQAPANRFQAGSLRTVAAGDGVLRVEGTPGRGAREYIPGGVASGRPVRSFNAADLREGTKVEMEHTQDPRIAREIAMDHLAEDPNYYRRLREIHKEKR